MSSVYERFRNFYREEKAVAEDVIDRMAEEEAEAHAAIVADARIAMGTKLVKDYMTWLDVEMAANEPNPDLGIEQAAARGFIQATLRRCKKHLEDKARLAQEHGDA